jgi:hypothetical protein
MEPASAVGKIASAGYRPHKRTNCRNREGFMRRLSISLAWEQTKSCLTADGRLLATVAAAFVALPLVVTGVLMPDGFSRSSADPLWSGLLLLFVALMLLTAQLALVRLSLSPSVSVGEALAHSVRRLPSYLLAWIVIGIGFFIVVTVAAAILIASGVQVSDQQIPASPATWAVMIALVAIYCVIWVRVIAMAAPIASAESVGPVALIRKSWDLTVGHFWRLLGFALLFFVGGAIAVWAVAAVTALLVRVLFGAPDPLSVSALILAIFNAVANAAVVTILTVMLARIYVQLSGRGSIDVSVPSSGT